MFMIEKVGNIVLNYKYYPGEDLYSDGKIEDELLEISKNYNEYEWNRVIAERKNWPILYHFSHIRQNITDWLPITKADTVLEIGSGCGAITGNLAKKAKHVTCIELSQKRSMINAYRNRNFDNVEILVGNFQDIEKDLDEKYDYITLIGVFEYSEGYIGTESPYTDMLKTISRHLKLDGKLIIAIENRLGMKYWAGCTEDHVGKFFEGIEDYPETSGVKTFSKKEMDEIFQEVGNLEYSMYYPYPDYKFPMVIYSEQWLPEMGELRTVDYNFDRKRMKLFDEIRAFDTVIKNDLFPVFSNSFLLVASLKDAKRPLETCIYSKFSNERSDEFSLRTEIWEDDKNKKSVRKVAATTEGQNHIEHIYQYMQQLNKLYDGTRISVNKGILTNEGISLEYLEGITLEQILDQHISEKNYDAVWTVLEQYLHILKRTGKEEFVKTSEFIHVFGDIDLPPGLMCPSINNIDAICSNIIVGNDGKWRMLDYEWSFEFPIPVNYQIYRVLKYFLYTSTSRAILIPMNYFERMGITEQEIVLYDEMEVHFQQYIQGSKIPMRHMYKDISPGVLFDIKDTEFRTNFEKITDVQIYYDRGVDFSETDCTFVATDSDHINFSFDVAQDVQKVRMDPCSDVCIVKVLQIQAEQGDCDIMPYICNGNLIGEHMYFFETIDPYFIIETMEKGKYNVQMQVQRFSKKELPFVAEQCVKLQDQLRAETGKFLEKQHELNLARIQEYELQVKHNELQAEHGQLHAEFGNLQAEHGKLLAEFEQLKAELARRNALIHEMENTKVWKVYETVKGIKKK